MIDYSKLIHRSARYYLVVVFRRRVTFGNSEACLSAREASDSPGSLGGLIFGNPLEDLQG